MYYTIYKITNNINGKIYIGVHKTNNLFDDYYGSGKYLNNAINKYGIKNFSKEIMQLFYNSEQMYEMEGLIVSESFVNKKNTYNLKIGGEGGWDNLNDGSKEHIKRTKKGGKNAINKLQEFLKEKWKNPEFIKKEKERLKNNFLGKQHTKETIEKIKKSIKDKQKGKLNSQYGTCWIYNLKLEQNKKIPKDNLQEWFDNGWIKGRKMNFYGSIV